MKIAHTNKNQIRPLLNKDKKETLCGAMSSTNILGNEYYKIRSEIHCYRKQSFSSAG